MPLIRIDVPEGVTKEKKEIIHKENLILGKRISCTVK